MLRTTISVIGFVLSAITLPITARAAELKFLCAAALRPTMQQMIPKFEQSSGYKVIISYAPVGAIATRIQNGEAADVAIVSKAQMVTLIKARKITEKTDVGIAKVGVGVFVRKGAPKPDISSTDAFKNTLLTAKAVAFNNPQTGGPVGAYLASLLQHLGIAEQMKSKIILTASGIAGTAEALSKGNAEIGFSQMIDIAPDVELVGPLPQPIQHYTLFWAGVAANTKERDGSNALLTFITSPQLRAALKAKGFEPG